jgi:hypothetical protein
MPSGRWLGAGRPAFLGPDASLWAVGRDSDPGDVRYGFALHEKGGRHLVDLGIDSLATVPTFDADGRTFAWCTIEGAVYVAELNEVQRRLAAVGLGW